MIGTVLLAVFGSGGAFAVLLKYLDKVGRARAAETIRVAELESKREADKAKREADAAKADAERQNRELIAQYEHHQEVVGMLRAEILALRKLDREHRIEMRDSLVAYREQLE